MEPSGSRQSPAAPWPPGAGAPRGPPPSCCPGAGRPFSAPTRPPAPSRHASGTRLRGGPVALRSIFVLALWHPRTPLSSLWRSGPERTRTDLALWHPRPERTRTDLALRRARAEPASFGRRRGQIGPVSGGGKRGTMTLGEPGISQKADIGCASPITQGAFRRC
jgi:hypothetical protein